MTEASSLVKVVVGSGDAQQTFYEHKG